MIELIWKFPLPNKTPNERFTIEMPAFSKILNAQWQEGVGPCIWALVSDGHKDRLVERTFAIYETGRAINPITGLRHEYIATMQIAVAFNLGLYVCHLFEWKKY